MFVSQNFQSTIEKPLSAIYLFGQFRVDQLLFLYISVERGDFRGFEVAIIGIFFFSYNR